jgi:hypothetical protein
MQIKLHEVTWYSRLVAIILFFLVVPVVAFFIGKQYQQVYSYTEDASLQAQLASSMNPLTSYTRVAISIEENLPYAEKQVIASFPSRWILEVYSENNYFLNNPKGADISIIKKETSQTVEEYMAEVDSALIEGSPVVYEASEPKTKKIGSTEVIERSESWAGAGFQNILVTYVKHGSNIFRISMQPVSEDGGVNEKEKEEYRNIVSSFQFK